jgi:RNA polymerase subunit RPABC4/transcription elongation factor Spt4
MIVFDASSFSERMGNGGRSGKGGGAEAHRQLLSGGPDRPAGAGVAQRNGRNHQRAERPIKQPGGRIPGTKTRRTTNSFYEGGRKTMRKRILSILLCLVMVVGLFPTMASADDSGATTGSGTKSDPYCVSTYAEMKRLLQTRASYYIKVVGMDNDATNDGVPVRVLVAGKDFESTEPAIDIPSGANHHLEIATKIWFITDPMDGNKNIFGRLIDVERGSSLEVTGTGSLRVEVNTLVATNAIICNWGGELTIDGSVVLSGIQDFTSNVATRPIYINGGITNIKGGYIYGHNNMKATSDGITSAIHFGDPLGKGTALNISGGTIRQYNNEINQDNENSCALYVDNDTVANAIHLTGGTFEGGMKMKTGKPLSDLLTAGYQFNDMSTNTVFDGSVSKTQKALVVTPAGVDTTIINNVSLTVEKSPNERETLSDFDCSYSQNDKMVLDNFGVYPGLNSTSKEIKDHNTPYDSSADYTVMYVFKKKDGFSFSSDVEKHVTVSGGEFWKADQMGGKKGLLRVFVNFPSSSNPNRVKEVSMTMNSKGDFKTIEDLKCQSFVPADKLELVNQMFFAGLKDTANEHTIQDLTTAYQPAADYTGVYVFKLKSGFSFAQDITDLAKKHVTISEGEIYSMDTMTDTDGAMLLRVFVSFEGTGSSIEKVTLNTPTRSEINQAASSVGFMPTSYTPSEKMSYGLQVMVGLDQDGTGLSLEDGKFDAKQDYSVRYNLQPKDGFAFAEGFSAKDVTVSNGTVYKVEMSGKDCYVYVNFPAKAAEDPNYVTEAAVQVAAVAGEIPSNNGITVTSSNADKIKKALVLWSNTSTPFVAGQEYSTTVYLEPKEGVTFADDMKLNVNGKVVNLAKKDPNGSVQFLVKITATGSTHTHSYNQETVKPEALKTPADCTSNAVYFKSCSCGAISTDDADTFTAINSALGHAWPEEGSWSKDTDKHWYECSRCHLKKDEAAHDYGDDDICDICTYDNSVPHTHNLTLVDENPATCTTPGNKAYYTCDGCDKWFEDATGSVEITDKTSVILTANGHTPSGWKSDADNHWKECTVVGCGVIIEDSKAAHTASEWITDTPATATTDGTKHKECTECGYVMETGTIPATGSGEHTHSYGSDWKSNADKHWHECSCGAKAEEAAHTASKWITDTAATATTDGTKHKECTVCHRVLETDTIPATGSGEHTHSYSSDWKSDSINHWHECSCGVKDDVAAHSFKWVVDKEATATKKGSKHEECKFCGYQRPAVEIPATGSTTKPTDPTESNPNTGALDDVPQPGDNSNMILWIVLLLASGLGVTGTVVYSKRKKYAK